MKKHLVFLLLAAGLPFAASAQKATTKQECNRRCNDADIIKFDGNPKQHEYNNKIDAVQAKIKVETDPVKLKALQEEKADLVEQRADHRERMCSQICAHNPEE